MLATAVTGRIFAREEKKRPDRGWQGRGGIDRNGNYLFQALPGIQITTLVSSVPSILIW